jgi:hypothetical protein
MKNSRFQTLLRRIVSLFSSLSIIKALIFLQFLFNLSDALHGCFHNGLSQLGLIDVFLLALVGEYAIIDLRMSVILHQCLHCVHLEEGFQLDDGMLLLIAFLMNFVSSLSAIT